MSRDLVDALATLRRERRQQSGLDPRLVPADNDAAYRIAGEVAAALGWAVAGWKIAAAKQAMQRALRTTSPIYGRVFAPFVVSSPAELPRGPLLHPLVEPEYVARLGADLPPRAKPFTQDEVADAVASLHPGVEIAECRFVHDAAFPPLPAILADGAASGTVVLGAGIAGWRDLDVADQDVVMRVNGVERRRGTARVALDHPLVPLTWLANELSRTGVGLKAGQIVSTGTLTGMVLAKPHEHYVVDYGPFGTVEVRFGA
jgi:2-keto-4-pentenoate hydratase